MVETVRIGRLCEEFPGVAPAALVRELETDPEQWAVRIAEARAYERAYRAMHAAKSDDDLDPRDPMLARVKRTQAAILREG